MNDTTPEPSSPAWSPTTKMVIGLTVVAIVAALLIQFRTIIGPLILAFMLAYVLYPVASRLSTSVNIPWKTAVNLIYLLVVILVGVSFTLTGLTVVQQVQSLIGFVQRNVTNLPALAADLSSQTFTIGPFTFDLAQFDLQTLSEQLLATIQPLLGRVGSLISIFAASAAVTVGWGLFVLVISYFLLADAGTVPDRFVLVEIPGYDSDFRRLGRELKKIWNAFLRGQLIIMVLVMISYTVIMVIFGMRFAIGIAILAGLGRFVPYLGPLILWIVTALVAFFQEGNYLGIEPLQYAIIVLVVVFVVDQIFDNLITPRFFGQTLGVHPAAVLVAAIIAANLIGIIGLILAAPALATLSLAGRYILRKMVDLDPWPEPESEPVPIELPWTRWIRRLRPWWRSIKK